MNSDKSALPLPPPRETDPTALAAEIIERLTYRIGKNAVAAQPHDWLAATILVIRDRVIDRWIASTRDTYQQGAKRVYYLSLEFLIGRLMRDAVSNLGFLDEMRLALAQLGVDIDVVAALEPDAALGNGGLGRLAACFMESMATVDVPAYGYGIRYVNGMFRQEIHDGWQVELPETWLAHGNPWEFERREASYEIGFGGLVEPVAADGSGGDRRIWKPSERVIATAYDTPVVGWRAERVNTLRLWTAQPIDPILLDAFNAGDHIGALRESNKAESLARVLYPADSTPAGQELRLRQEYFFSLASLQDIVRRHVQYFGDIRTLPDKAAIQLNDTHPAVSVAELLRILMDDHGLDFEESWDITRRTFSYTNHTLLPEALESWPLPLFERLLPRHMQLIYAVNAKLLIEARRVHKLDDRAISAISLIDEHDGRRVRMANLAFVGSHSINGVAALHTELMKETVFADLHRMYPDRINNKTNGITPRRWLMQCNPGLTGLIREAIGDDFMDDAEKLTALVPFADDAAFREKFRAVKDANKAALSNLLRQRMGIRLDPQMLFDVQIKRIHEYKRQLLNALHIVVLYNRLRAAPNAHFVPRTFFFAGKAAPAYHLAKLIIKFINSLSATINVDPVARGRLQVHFLPEYNVSLAERLIPASDVSEQISTAGYEASGTGNMKFMMNGALTVGTRDGATIEMAEAAGEENFFLFGLSAQQVADSAGWYDPWWHYHHDEETRAALDLIFSNHFNRGEPGIFEPLRDALLVHGDHYRHLADLTDYARAQREVSALYADPEAWSRKAVLNVAYSGRFSSDRTIREYAEHIWGLRVSPVG